MQNISPLFFLSKEQKSKISESESSINSRTCLGHLVLLVHAVMHQTFGNTVGLNLALCLKELYVDPAKRRHHGHIKDAGPRSIYEQPLTCDLNGNISFSIDIFFIHFAKSHSPWLKPLGSWLGLQCRFQKRVSQQKVDVLIFKPTLKFFYLPPVHSALLELCSCGEQEVSYKGGYTAL